MTAIDSRRWTSSVLPSEGGRFDIGSEGKAEKKGRSSSNRRDTFEITAARRADVKATVTR